MHQMYRKPPMEYITTTDATEKMQYGNRNNDLRHTQPPLPITLCSVLATTLLPLLLPYALAL